MSTVTPPLDRAGLSHLVHPRERVYFVLAAAIGLGVYIVLVLALLSSAEARPLILFYGLGIVLFTIISHGFLLGHVRGNGVRVSARQFPKLHQVVETHAGALGMREAPDVYVMQAGGLLNAFATRFLGRNFVVLYSDVVALAESQGEEAVSFVVAHELGHIKRGHLQYRWLLLPARIIPFLGSAYSRACEYTCDRIGAYCAPDGAVSGLLVLAAGKDLYRQVEPRLFAYQVETETGFWVTCAEIFSSHPRLPKRVSALLRSGAPISGVELPAYSLVTGTVPRTGAVS